MLSKNYFLDVRATALEESFQSRHHDLGNLNYSFIGDAFDSNTGEIGRLTVPICAALRALGVDAELSGRNDILAEGRKLSGVAQRIDDGRILHHGTLLFDADTNMMSRVLKAHAEKFISKSSKSVRSRVGNLSTMLPEKMDMEQFWQKLKEYLGAYNPLIPSNLSAGELEEVGKLAEKKYRSWEWTWGSAPSYRLKNRARFAGGSIELSIDVVKGVITEASFTGDFMSAADVSTAAEALKGVRHDEHSIACALSLLPLRNIFGGISAEEIAKLAVLADSDVNR